MHRQCSGRLPPALRREELATSSEGRRALSEWQTSTHARPPTHANSPPAKHWTPLRVHPLAMQILLSRRWDSPSLAQRCRDSATLLTPRALLAPLGGAPSADTFSKNHQRSSLRQRYLRADLSATAQCGTMPLARACCRGSHAAESGMNRRRTANRPFQSDRPFRCTAHPAPSETRKLQAHAG